MAARCFFSALVIGRKPCFFRKARTRCSSVRLLTFTECLTVSGRFLSELEDGDFIVFLNVGNSIAQGFGKAQSMEPFCTPVFPNIETTAALVYSSELYRRVLQAWDKLQT